MSDLSGWAAGLAVLSVGLAVGWAWLKRQVIDSPFQSPGVEQWSIPIARFFYFVGLPYLALVSGILTTRLLGLNGLEYFGMISVGPGSSLASIMADLQVALVLMLLEWFVDSSRTILVGLAALAILGGVWFSLASRGLSDVGAAPLSLLDVIYSGLHWSFYRAIFWLITGDLYLGVILGMAVASVEAVLVARLARDWPAPQFQLLTNGMILILTATVFFYSPNLWLLWPVHGAMIMVVRLFTSHLSDSKPTLSEPLGHR